MMSFVPSHTPTKLFVFLFKEEQLCLKLDDKQRHRCDNVTASGCALQVSLIHNLPSVEAQKRMVDFAATNSDQCLRQKRDVTLEELPAFLL